MERRIRLRWLQIGGHIHCRLFTSNGVGSTFAKCGDLVFNQNEWPAIANSFAVIADVIREDADADAQIGGR